MKKKSEKYSKPPTPEAKALSLFFMAYKSKNPAYKEQAKRINKLWDKVGMGELNQKDYNEQIQKVLLSYGGYEEVLEKTIRYYINKTGEWKSTGGDKYSIDAKKIANKILKEE